MQFSNELNYNNQEMEDEILRFEEEINLNSIETNQLNSELTEEDDWMKELDYDQSINSIESSEIILNYQNWNNHSLSTSNSIQSINSLQQSQEEELVERLMIQELEDHNQSNSFNLVTTNSIHSTSSTNSLFQPLQTDSENDNEQDDTDLLSIYSFNSTSSDDQINEFDFSGDFPLFPRQSTPSFVSTSQESLQDQPTVVISQRSLKIRRRISITSFTESESDHPTSPLLPPCFSLHQPISDERVRKRIVLESDSESSEDEEEFDWEDFDGVPFQLKALELDSDSDDDDEDDDKNKDVKRLAIIRSLQLITLSILQQLSKSILPRPQPVLTPESPNSSPSSKPTQPKRRLPKASSIKSNGISVILAKRTGTYDPTMIESNVTGPHSKRAIRYPNSRSTKGPHCGSKELAIFLAIVEILIDSLERNVVVTKRDIFYRNVALFKTQNVVDSIVEDLAATLQIRRNELNILAASKGLFAGGITIIGKDGVKLEGGLQGALIPPGQSIATIEVDDVKWILIVEKEAVFRSLCVEEFLNHSQLPKGIIITGKGYPDVSTRELIQQLSIDLSEIPILALLDSDPHGLQILSTYVHGSASMRYDEANLAVSRIEWIGVKATEWEALGVEEDKLLVLSDQERKLAITMLRNRDWWDEEWKKELTFMIDQNQKAEIEILMSLKPSNRPDCRVIPEEWHEDIAMEEEEVNRDKCPLIQYVINKIIERLHS